MPSLLGDDVAPPVSLGVPRIAVIGVGGAGGNAINNMIRADLEGVDFWVANTDAQALEQSSCESQIQLGANLTHGLGAGSRPEIGQAAAEEANEAITAALRGANMTFITAGMGGGTGTGGAPVIAQIAREEGMLTVGVVSKPFDFEGARRMRQAEEGIAELSKFVDTLIVVPNQNLFRVADDKTTFADAFKLADEVLHSGVRGITDLMVLPGLVNLDFADIRSIMAGMGKAVMGTGEAEGENRALAAAQAAISNPLLADFSMKGARSVLINITGGLDLMLMEVDEAANRIREEVDPDANIIFGSALSHNLDGKIRVSVIATGNELEPSQRLPLKSSSPFVSDQPGNPDTEAAEKIHHAGGYVSGAPIEKSKTLEEWVPNTETLVGNEADIEPADRSDTSLVATTADDSMIVRLASFFPAPDEDPASLSQDGHTQLCDSDSMVAEDANPVWAAPRSSTTDVNTTLFEWGTAQDANTTDNSNIMAPTIEATAERLPERSPIGKSIVAFQQKFRRPAKSIKSESTLQEFENNRKLNEAKENTVARPLYFVWETNLGARICKVPAGQVASVREQACFSGLNLYDDLEKARVEASIMLKRLTIERIAAEQPRPILEPSLSTFELGE